MRKKARQGLWHSGAESFTEEQRREYAKMGGAVRVEQIKAAIEAGTWKHPSEYPGVREKLSRPRKHADNPELHRAFEKLGQGARMADLHQVEAEAVRAYRRKIRAADPERFRRYDKRAYQRRLATEEGRAKERAKWRKEKKRLRERQPNDRLRQAREQAGLSRAALAEAVGVSAYSVGQWERYSVMPSAVEVRREVAEVLGVWPWPVGDQEEEARPTS
jgi:ribosome-binding protein aMBF1 (putative translation factor)